jgi:hypothetical protein
MPAGTSTVSSHSAAHTHGRLYSSAIRLFRSEAIDNDINLDAKIRPSARATDRPLHDPPNNTDDGGFKKRGRHDRRSTVFGQSEARRPFNANDDVCRRKYIIIYVLSYVYIYIYIYLYIINKIHKIMYYDITKTFG